MEESEKAQNVNLSESTGLTVQIECKSKDTLDMDRGFAFRLGNARRSELKAQRKIHDMAVKKKTASGCKF